MSYFAIRQGNGNTYSQVLSAYNYDSRLTSLYNYSNLSNVVYYNGGDTYSKTYNYTFLRELICDNDTNNCISFYKDAIKYDAITAVGYSSGNRRWFDSDTRKYIQLNKNLFSLKTLSQNTYSIHSHIDRSSGMIVYDIYINVNVNFCFRPVFQYKDNSKSNNIYY